MVIFTAPGQTQAVCVYAIFIVGYFLYYDRISQTGRPRLIR